MAAAAGSSGNLRLLLPLLLPTELWRKGWDSNPRNPFEVHYISNVANSTALAPFHVNQIFKPEKLDRSLLRHLFDDDLFFDNDDFRLSGFAVVVAHHPTINHAG